MTQPWRRWCRAVSTALVATLIATPAICQERWRVRSLAEIRYEGVIAQRWDTSCGAAALATVLTFDLGDPVPERTIATSMLRRATPIRVKSRGGFSLLDMQEFAEARGYEADGYGDMEYSDLQGMLPAIVPIRIHGYDHFVVVREIKGGKVFFADPAYGRRDMTVSQFERAWEQKIAFVVRRRPK